MTLWRGTEGSNPPPSSREMDSNLQYRAVKGSLFRAQAIPAGYNREYGAAKNRCSQVREAVISFPSHSALLWLRRAMSRWSSGPQGWVGANPILKFSLSRRLPAVCSGYRGHAYASRRGSRHGSAFLLLRPKPLHRARLGHGLSGWWLAALRGGSSSALTSSPP